MISMCLMVFMCLVVSNVLYAMIVSNDWRAAGERCFFQGVALALVVISDGVLK